MLLHICVTTDYVILSSHVSHVTAVECHKTQTAVHSKLEFYYNLCKEMAWYGR